MNKLDAIGGYSVIHAFYDRKARGLLATLKDEVDMSLKGLKSQVKHG